MSRTRTQETSVRRSNPLQTVALNLCVFAGCFAAVRTIGFQWGLALLVAWLGGAVLTLVLVFVVGKASLVSHSTVHFSDTANPSRNPTEPTTLTRQIASWEEDASDEVWQAIAQDSAGRAGRRERRHVRLG